MYLLIDNYDSFTYNIYQYFREISSSELKVVRHDEITIAEIETMQPEGIIISPGPGDPSEAGISVEVIKTFKGRIPILGICLGHQCIGEAFGGKIIRASRIVHGMAEEIRHDGKGVFRGMQNPGVFTRYHSLVIEKASLPEELVITAESADGEIMGVRHRDYAVEGVQFHPESVASSEGKKLLSNFINYRRDAFDYKAFIGKLNKKEDLSFIEAAAFMEELTEGGLSSIQLAGILTAMNVKGIRAEEIAGCASVLRRKKISIKTSRPVLDTCGTGGDESGSFNISSLSAIIACSAGAAVAKHGNRAVSSKCGSAEFFRELGVPVDISPAEAEELLDKTGFAFLFAPVYHSAMKHAVEARKGLGIKTLMNLLGPLSNPADADYQLIGVYSDEYCERIARAAKMLGIKRVLVVNGLDGLDEISVSARTKAVSVNDFGEIKNEIIDPESICGMLYKKEELAGNNAAENAAAAERILRGEEKGALKAAVLINAGAALAVCGIAKDIKEGYTLAEKALESGAAWKKLQQLREEGKKFGR
jgi:anthranilate synthase/phosphoribosyltransferase